MFNATRSIAFKTPVTFFVGENGTGKSTLLKAISHKCKIHVWKDPERRQFRYNRYAEELYRHITVEWADEPVPGSFFASEIFQDLGPTFWTSGRWLIPVC